MMYCVKEGGIDRIIIVRVSINLYFKMSVARTETDFPNPLSWIYSSQLRTSMSINKIMARLNETSMYGRPAPLYLRHAPTRASWLSPSLSFVPALARLGFVLAQPTATSFSFMMSTNSCRSWTLLPEK